MNNKDYMALLKGEAFELLIGKVAIIAKELEFLKLNMFQFEDRLNSQQSDITLLSATLVMKEKEIDYLYKKLSTYTSTFKNSSTSSTKASSEITTDNRRSKL